MEELCEAVHVELWGLGVEENLEEQEQEEEENLEEEVQEEKIFGEEEN